MLEIAELLFAMLFGVAVGFVFALKIFQKDIQDKERRDGLPNRSDV